MTLFPQAESWIFGANIPGKKKAVMFSMAEIGASGRRQSRSGDHDELDWSGRVAGVMS
jgi:hypothetical protein